MLIHPLRKQKLHGRAAESALMDVAVNRTDSKLLREKISPCTLLSDRVHFNQNGKLRKTHSSTLHP